MFFRTCNPNTFIARYCYVKRVSKSVVGHPAIHKQHSQTFANLCRCSPIFPLILKNQTGMFPCHRSRYLQRHIVPVSIWIWVKDFRIATEKSAPSAHRLLDKLLRLAHSTACCWWPVGVRKFWHSKIWSQQSPLPHDGFRLDSSVTQPLGFRNQQQKHTNVVSNPATHRWGSSQGRPDAVLAFRTKVTGGLDIGFMALEDSKDGAWRTRTVEAWWKWHGCFRE